MKVGDTIVANISFTGNSKGKENRLLTNEEGKSQIFALAEGDGDSGFEFKFDTVTRNFYIEKERLQIKKGVRYKFRGIGSNDNFSDPVIVVPQNIKTEEITTAIVDAAKLENNYYTKVKCNIKIDEKLDNESFLFISIKSESGADGKVSFEKDYHAYKVLNQKNGFLVDYNRIKDKTLEFFIEFTEPTNTKTLNIEFGNVTESFYHHNYYHSNVHSGINNNLNNPATAGFNIWTEKAYGSFSANASFVERLVIR